MVKWLDEYSTGIDRVDEQHKLIFQMAGDFREALDVGKGDKTYRVLLEFLQWYCEAHFSFEDRCMEEYRCPAAEANRVAHGVFNGLVHDYWRRFEADGFSPTDARELVDMVEGWFLGHIRHVDVQLKESVDASSGAT